MIFHGRLAELVGDSFDIEARSIREAIEGFSRQHPAWPREMLVRVAGYDTVNSLEDVADEIHLMPALTGEGGNFGKILIGAALIGIAFIPGGGAVAAPLIGKTLATAFISLGAGLILQGAMGLFMKSPILMGKNKDPEASKYIAVGRNTVNSGTLVTLAYGRIDLGGHWVSIQVDSNNLSYGTFPTVPT